MTLNTNLTSNMTDASPADAIFHERLTLDRLMKQLYFNECGDKKSLPAGKGKTIQYLRYGNLAAITSALTEGTPPNGQALTTTVVDATPVQYGGFISYSDRLDLESVNDLQKEMDGLVGYQAGLSLDTITRNALHNNMTNQFAGGAANELAVTAVFLASEIRKAKAWLSANDVHPFSDGSFRGLIHPYSTADLQSDSAAGAWLDVLKYVDNKNILNGEIGKLYGVRFMETSNIQTGVNTPGDVTYRNWIFGDKSFLTVDVDNKSVQRKMKKPGTSGVSDPLDQIGTVGWIAYHIAEVSDANRAVEIYATSAFTPA